MARFAKTTDGWISFHCPGCEGGHGIPVEGAKAWSWNGSLDSPTVNPSILVNAARRNPSAHVCHSFIREGRIQFLADCTHKLAGQTVEIPDWDRE
jgi:hypothetical protein